MYNFVEFFRMVFSYLFVMVIIGVVSFLGGVVGLKVWKPKKKDETEN